MTAIEDSFRGRAEIRIRRDGGRCRGIHEPPGGEGDGIAACCLPRGDGIVLIGILYGSGEYPIILAPLIQLAGTVLVGDAARTLSAIKLSSIITITRLLPSTERHFMQSMH